MSCGSHHDLNCADALSWVYEYIDDEIDDRRRVEILQHLRECPPCEDQFALEQMVKALVHRSCQCEPAPEELRIRIVARIQEIRITYRRG